MITYLHSQLGGLVIGSLATLFVVVVVLFGDLRPFSADRRWSRKYRAMRADISRINRRFR